MWTCYLSVLRSTDLDNLAVRRTEAAEHQRRSGVQRLCSHFHQSPQVWMFGSVAPRTSKKVYFVNHVLDSSLLVTRAKSQQLKLVSGGVFSPILQEHQEPADSTKSLRSTIALSFTEASAALNSLLRCFWSPWAAAATWRVAPPQSGTPCPLPRAKNS